MMLTVPQMSMPFRARQADYERMAPCGEGRAGRAEDLRGPKEAQQSGTLASTSTPLLIGPPVCPLL